MGGEERTGAQTGRAKAYLMLVSSMLIFGTIGIFRRYIPLSSGALAFSRGLMGTLTLILFTRLSGRGGKRTLNRWQMGWLGFSGMLMGVNWMLLFEAYRYTTVATATLCYYMQPTLVILLSPLLLKEKLTPVKLICAAVSLLGMVLVSGLAGEDAAAQGGKGVALGLGAALFYGAVVLMNKKMPQGDAYERTTVQLLAAAVVMVPYLFFSGPVLQGEMTPLALAMLLVVGVVHTGVAYALYFGSLGRLKGQFVAVISYLDPVSALLLSALFLQEPITPAGTAGAVLILGAALVSELCGGKKEA